MKSFNDSFRLSLIVLATFITSSVFAQNQVRITLHQPPPNQLSAGDLWKMTLENTTGSPIEIYLAGYGEDEKEGRIVDGTSPVFTLPVGRTNYNYENFKSGNVSWKNRKYEEFIVRTGQVPAGSYTTCVTAYSSEGILVGMEKCITQIISRGFEGEISLIAPGDGENIDPSTLITFAWTPLPNGGSYKIKIVEVIGDQSPEVAMLRNKAFFEKEDIRMTSFQYPSSAPNFEEGKKYVWLVIINNISSSINRFIVSGRICSMLNVIGEPITMEENRCCVKLTLINKYTGKENQPYGFNIILPKPISVTEITNTAAGWSHSQSVNAANISSVVWQTRTPFPDKEINLGTMCVSASASGTFYIKYEWLDNNKKIICKDSVKVTCPGSDQAIMVDSVCTTNIISNGNFVNGNIQGVMPSGSVTDWATAYGTPKVINDPNEGCWDIGNIELSGNKFQGQAIMQVLNSNNKIVQGKKYRFSIAVKFLAQSSGTDYVKIRLVAFNNNLPTGTNHPAPSTNIAIVGVSSKIKECAGWTIVTLPVWTANKNFDKIAISAENNEQNSISYAYIDNIQLCDVNDDDLNCNEIPLDAQGNPVIPSDLVSFLNSSCPSVTEDIEIEMGNINDLYGANGIDTWYQNSSDECVSIGGTIPDEVNNYNCDDSLKALGINMTCDEMDKFLNQVIEIKEEEIKIDAIRPLSGKRECETNKFVPNPDLPFGGRDIIYVHGLKLDHLCDKENNVNGADGVWPDNPAEFFTGYFKQVAETGWSDHIWNFLRNRNWSNAPSNRYLVVDYNCNQRLEYGVSAVLSQIREAMENGTGVVPSATNKTTDCFGKEYVIISHSTGGLLVDVMLSIMKKSTIDPVFTAKWGNLEPLLKGCKTHIAMHPALSGSNMAKIFVLGNLDIETSVFLSAISMKKACQNPSWVKPNTVSQSILIDLMPHYAQSVWGPYIASVPVDVIVTAGGQGGSPIDKGIDDGVLSMDCQCGNPTLHSLAPTTYSPSSSSKVFDMGIPFGRAVRFYLDQKESGGQFSSGCIPFLSPTGMVQPVVSFQPSTLARYPKHYSFIQTASDHMKGPRGHGGDTETLFDLNNPSGTTGYILPDKNYPTKHGPNWEEVRAVTDAYLYNSGLVNIAISNMVNEEIRGLKYSFTIWYPGFKNWRLVWISKTFEFWIWKRKYHLLQDSRSKTECDYIYDYVLR